MRLIFVRHGESADNKKANTLNTKDTPLTELGIDQAKQTGKFLAENFPKAKLIISSPYPRTFDTGKYIAEHYKKISIELSDLVVEGDNGLLTGLERKEVLSLPSIGKRVDKIIKVFETASLVELTQRTRKIQLADQQLSKLVGGESFADLRVRAKKAFKFLCKKAIEINGDIIIVSHNGFISSLISEVFNLNEDGQGSNYKYTPEGKKISNCHVSVICIDGKPMLELMKYNKFLT